MPLPRPVVARLTGALLVAGLLVAGLLPALAVPASAAPPPRPGQPVPGQFIVELRQGADAAAVAREYAGRGARVRHVYRSSLRGFAGRMSDAAVRQARSDRRVARVEVDRVVALRSTTRTGATWGLDRLDQRDLPLDGAYTSTRTGSGVVAYVIDTGIRATHRDLRGRVAAGFTAIEDGRGTGDCHGHGTHVAGTIGSTVHGVAQGVTLVPVRVLDCNGSGTWSGVLAGIDYVSRDRQAGRRAPAVANMSLGGPASSAVDSAVDASIAAGVAYSVAAGNSSTDACGTSPARVPAAVTVGATDSADARASFSNTGSCLDLFAPGVSITSSSHGSDTATATMSGTSMAAPHVAGVLAAMLEAAPATTPSALSAALLQQATAGRVSAAGTGSPNLLLHAAVSGTAPEPVDEPVLDPPVASATRSCSGSQCTFTSTSTGTIERSTWRLASGAIVEGTSATERYAGTGTSTVTLTVANAAGSSTATQTVTCGWSGKGKRKTLVCG